MFNLKKNGNSYMTYYFLNYNKHIEYVYYDRNYVKFHDLCVQIETYNFHLYVVCIFSGCSLLKFWS